MAEPSVPHFPDDALPDLATQGLMPSMEAVQRALPQYEFSVVLPRVAGAGEVIVEAVQSRLGRPVVVRLVTDGAVQARVAEVVREMTARGEANVIYEAGLTDEGWGYVVTGTAIPRSALPVRRSRGLAVLVLVVLLAGAVAVWEGMRVKEKPVTAAPRVTYPLPMKIGLRGVGLSAEMQAAKERGGRLRCWGKFRDRYTLAERPEATEKWDDFVRVQGDPVQFAALRKNRELFGWHAGRTGERHFWKPEVTAISRGYRMYFQAGGKVFSYQASVPQITLARPGVLMAVESYGYIFSLSEDGLADWRDVSPQKISRAPAPSDQWARVSQVAAGGHGINFLDEMGRLHPWQSSEGLISNQIKEMNDIVEIDVGAYLLITLSEDGTVRLHGNVPPAMQVPNDLGKCVAVRAGENCCAAQRPDGTWRAWSVDPEIAAQVAKIGKAIDLDLEVAGPPWDVNTGTPRRYVVWIEPVFDAPTRTPLGEQAFGGSRYEFVHGQPTWAEAKAKAEKMGGHLATLDSAAEAQWLMKTFGDAELSDGRAFWIGGEALEMQKGWRWVTGPEAKGVPWLTNRPAVGVDEDAGAFPAWMAVQQVGDAVGVYDCSDNAASIRHWANHIVGFVVERER